MTRAGANGRERAAYLALLTLAALDAAAYSVIAPVVPAIADATGVGPAPIGALVASFGIGMAIGFALAGRGVQERGASFVLAVSVAVVAGGSAGFVLGDGFPLYLASRVVMGVGSGGLWIGVTFAVLDRYPGQEYRRLTRVIAAYSVGSLAGPAVGAINGIRGPFAAYLGLVGVSGVGAVLLLGPPRERATFSSDRHALRRPGFWFASAAILLVALALGTLEGPLPLHFAERLDQREIGAMYVAISLAVAVSAAAAARFAARPTVAAATALMVVGLSLAGATHSIPLWGVAVFVAALGFGLGEAASLGVLLDVVGTERVVLAMVVYSQVWALGYLAGPAAGGAVAGALGFAAIGLVPLAGAFLVLAAFLLAGGWERAYARP